MAAPSVEHSDTPNPPGSGNPRHCAFCNDPLSATTAKRFRTELICNECAAVVAAAQRTPNPATSIADRAAAIDTAAIATNQLAVGVVLSLLSVGGVVIGAILVGHATKDTWELDNAAKIHTLAAEANRLDTTDQRAALAKYEELNRLVGKRQVHDPELEQIVETARNRCGELESKLAAELAREREETRQREQAERDKRRREEEARAREEQQRREEAERREQAEALKRSAYLMSQEFVKESLKAPSSARFPEYTDSDVIISFDEATRKYTVIAWVEAQNPFGVYLRSVYMCRLWPAGGDLWRSDLTNLSSP